MWFLIWFLSTLLSCAFAIIISIWQDKKGMNKQIVAPAGGNKESTH